MPGAMIVAYGTGFEICDVFLLVQYKYSPVQFDFDTFFYIEAGFYTLRAIKIASPCYIFVQLLRIYHAD